MPAFTPIFDFYLPTVGGDGDVWGGYLNANWTALDSLLNTATNSVTRAVSSSPATITAADRNKLVLVDASGGAIVINFAAASTLGDGFKVSIKKIDATANTVTLNPDGAETIDGELTYVLGSENAAVTVGTDGSDLFIISTNAIVQNATTLVAGIVRLATVAETEAGSLDTVAVTPAGLTGAFATLLAGSLTTPTMQVFTSNGTWTRPGGCKKVKAYTVGAGGGANSTNAGGTSSFGAHCSGAGGAGGATSGLGGSATGGDINIPGGDADIFKNTGGAGTVVFSANGGGSFFGQVSSSAGKNYGSGGGCGYSQTLGSGSSVKGGGGGGTAIKYIDVSAIASVAVTVGTGGAGDPGYGNGGPGIVIVEEYYA